MPEQITSQPFRYHGGQLRTFFENGPKPLFFLKNYMLRDLSGSLVWLYEFEREMISLQEPHFL